MKTGSGSRQLVLEWRDQQKSIQIGTSQRFSRKNQTERRAKETGSQIKQQAFLDQIILEA